MNLDVALGDDPSASVRSDELVDYARMVLAESAALAGNDSHGAAYHLPFVDLDATFTHDEYRAHCDRGFACRQVSDPVRRNVRITVADATAVGISRPRQWWEQQYLRFDIERRLAAAGLHGSYFHDDDIWHFYDTEERRGVRLLIAPGRYPPWEVSAPLRILLHWIYAEMGFRLVHAATLGRNGRGVLIAGHGGAGKSGTTLAGVLAGLDSVGDDYVLVDPREPPTAYPLYRNMKQDSAGWARFRLGRLLEDPGPLNWQGKHEFDFERLGRGRRAASLKLEAVLIPTVSGRSRSRITPVKPRSAMLALMPTGVFQLPGETASGVRFFADLVHRLPSFAIELSSDADEIGAHLAAFIDGGAA